jgi:acetyl-CoA C-acetyltransferase
VPPLRQAAGKFNEEIVPITVLAGVADPKPALLTREVTLSADEGIRPDTTYEGVSTIRPAIPGRRDFRRQRQPVLRRCVGCV